MFIGPFDATMAWNERALMGVKRFLDRFERFVDENASTGQASSAKARAVVNRLVKQVDEDIEAFKFNTGLAKMMEALNDLEAQRQPVNPAELRIFCQCLAPYAPFLAESCWKKLGGKGSVHNTRWPVYDPALELEEGVEMAVQVNGKLRGTIQVERDAPDDVVRSRAEALESVARFLSQGEVVKVIIVRNRTINFVVR